MTNTKTPAPPFTAETAAQKVRLAEDGWNSRDRQKSLTGLYAGQQVA